MTTGRVLFIYLLVYVSIAFALPTYRVWKRLGLNPVTFGNKDTAHDFIGTTLHVSMAGVALTVGVHAFAPGAYAYLAPIAWLETPAVRFTGVSMLALSLLWTVAAQVQMGNSWRIGIDSVNRTALVETGLFRVSRNPIFLGMIVTLGGLFLTLPNALTLLFFGLGFVLIQIQTRLEEEFLSSVHGADYEAYRRRVRRWL